MLMPGVPSTELSSELRWGLGGQDSLAVEMKGRPWALLVTRGKRGVYNFELQNLRSDSPM